MGQSHSNVSTTYMEYSWSGLQISHMHLYCLWVGCTCSSRYAGNEVCLNGLCYGACSLFYITGQLLQLWQVEEVSADRRYSIVQRLNTLIVICYSRCCLLLCFPYWIYGQHYNSGQHSIMDNTGSNATFWEKNGTT